MRECRLYGSVRGAVSNHRPYREQLAASMILPEAVIYRRVLERPAALKPQRTPHAPEHSGVCDSGHAS